MIASAFRIAKLIKFLDFSAIYMLKSQKFNLKRQKIITNRPHTPFREHEGGSI